jgi:Tol biopolymer transport system component
MSRVTFDAASDRFPLWSPDGTRIVFGSSRSGPFEIYQKLAGGAGAEERLVPADELAVGASWSPDGRFLLYINNDQQTNTDLWVLPMAGDRTSSVFLKTPFAERWGTFSPDGQWVAYHSNESGQHEIYLRPFVPPGAAGQAAGQQQASTAGGVYPVWRRDGRELYYLNPEGAMMAVPITVTGATLRPGAPNVLFPTRILGGGVDRGLGPQYDVAPDGRFLINTELDDAAAPITLLMNWNPEVKK